MLSEPRSEREQIILSLIDPMTCGSSAKHLSGPRSVSHTRSRKVPFSFRSPAVHWQRLILNVGGCTTLDNDLLTHPSAPSPHSILCWARHYDCLCSSFPIQTATATLRCFVYSSEHFRHFSKLLRGSESTRCSEWEAQPCGVPAVEFG